MMRAETLAANNLTLEQRLRSITVDLEPGAITAICGPNGAGKSTLLGALSGLITPSGGEAMLGDRTIASLHPRERAQRIGYLPQDGEIAWDLAVRKLVALGRLPHRDDGHDAVEGALTALDLGAFSDRPVSTLSGGERARVLLARVLAGEPQWILADEPLAALDIAHQLALLAHLRREARSGTGILIVLHDLSLAMNHADRVLVLHEGALVADGPPADALGGAVLREIWNVDARWVGESGQQALFIGR